MFKYINNQLVLEQGKQIIPLQSIAEKEPYPFYIYDIQGIKDWYQDFLEQTAHRLNVFFAMKCNHNKEILKAFQDMGSGVDVVSGGEANLALDLGFSPEKIIFSGVGKSEQELEMSLSKGLLQINVESFEELKEIVRIAKKRSLQASIGLRLNPNVDIETHPYIKTGLEGHKFGIDERDLPQILSFIETHKDHLILKGLSMHIGSQFFDLQPFYQSIRHLKSVYESLKVSHPSLRSIDIGGGLGVDYSKEGLQSERDLMSSFGKEISQIFKDFEDSVWIEPGRFLVARFGLLCGKVEYIKKTPQKKFVILNTGMNHFLRPALYNAEHRVLPLILENSEKTEVYDVVGPICETGDSFVKDYSLPPLKRGDFMALADVGAYGFVMSNNYNLQLPVSEVSFLDGKKV